MQGLGRKMAKGAAWMVAFKFIERTLGLVSTMILARLLILEDFGVVAMAMSVVALLEMISMFSFDVALIQDQDAGRPQFDTAWTFNVLVKGATAFAVLGLAYPASAFYGEPRQSLPGAMCRSSGRRQQPGVGALPLRGRR